MNNLAFNKVDQILIPHTAFEVATERILQLFEASKTCEEPICMALVGEARTGKSRVLQHVSSMHPRERRNEGLYIPILRISTPSKPTVKGLAEKLLHEMGDPLWNRRGSENEKTERLIVLLAQTQTTMLIIDEFQHFYDKGSHKVQHHVSDWLKILVDKARLALVVSGLPSCIAVISQNEQLSGRFTGMLMMPRFDWINQTQKDQFTSTLESFLDALPEYEFPAFDPENMGFRFYCATGGLVGYIAKILRQATLLALFDERDIISLSDLEIAYEQAIWHANKPAIDNPFSPKFDPIPTPYVLNEVRKIGMAVPEEVRTRSSRKPTDKTISSADALVS